MKDAYKFAIESGIHPYLITSPTDAASQVDAINALGTLAAEQPYTHKSKAFYDAGRLVKSHLEQHAQSPHSEIANHAREALKKLAIMLG